MKNIIITAREGRTTALYQLPLAFPLKAGEQVELYLPCIGKAKDTLLGTTNIRFKFPATLRIKYRFIQRAEKEYAKLKK